MAYEFNPEAYQAAILRLGQGAYIFTNPETGMTYNVDVTRNASTGRFEIHEKESVVPVDSAAFPVYIIGLVLQGVILTGKLPLKEPVYIPLKF